MLTRSCQHNPRGPTNSYNAIAHIDQQRQIVPSSILHSLAEVFVRHSVHQEFGAFLLHRHRALASTAIMVHKHSDLNTDICTMEELGRYQVNPCMFFSQAPDEFLPFEYEMASKNEVEVLPSKSFLQELGKFLWDRGLEKTFGICRVSPDADPWIERLLNDDGDTVATRVDRTIGSSDGTITQWAFIREAYGEIRIKAFRACKETESGGHVRT